MKSKQKATYLMDQRDYMNKYKEFKKSIDAIDSSNQASIPQFIDMN